MIDKTLNYGRDQIRRFLQNAAPYTSVLDLGAGRGFDLAAARSVAPRARLHGLKNHPPYVEELRGKGIEVHSIDIERDVFPFPGESVDVVMTNQVMEHVKDIFWILHEASRVLRLGGHLIIGVPNLAALHNRVLLAIGRQPSSLKNTSAHLRGYTKGDMISLLSILPGVYEPAGFSGANFYPFPPAIAKPLARMLPSMSTSVFFDFRKAGPYGRDFLDHPAGLETRFFTGPAE